MSGWRPERCYQPSGPRTAADKSTWTMAERTAAYVARVEIEEAHRSCRLWMPCCGGDSTAAGERAAVETVREMRTQAVRS